MGLWDDLMSMRGGNNAIGRGVKSLDDAIAAWAAQQGYETTKSSRPYRDPQTGELVPPRREEITVNPVQSLLDAVQFGATLTDPQDYVELERAGREFSAQPSLPGGIDLLTAGTLAALPVVSGGMFRAADDVVRAADAGSGGGGLLQPPGIGHNRPPVTVWGGAEAPEGLLEHIQKLSRKDPAILEHLPYMTVEEIEALTPRSVDTFLRYAAGVDPAELAAATRAGAAKFGWYDESRKAINTVFGDDAGQFTALLAALSPQTSVESNLANATNVWANWLKAGRPTDRVSILRILGESVQGSGTEASVLDAWANNAVLALGSPADAFTRHRLSGPKVDSFLGNLVGDMDMVTNDAWIANLSGVPQAAFARRGDVNPGFGPGYIATSAATRRAAEDLSRTSGRAVTPANVQEAGWSYGKGAYETRASGGLGGPSVSDVYASGAITSDVLDSVPDFSTLLNDPRYGGALREAGYGKQLEAAAAAGRGHGADLGAPDPTALGAVNSRLERLYKDRSLLSRSAPFRYGADPDSASGISTGGRAAGRAPEQRRPYIDAGRTEDAHLVGGPGARWLAPNPEYVKAVGPLGVDTPAVVRLGKNREGVNKFVAAGQQAQASRGPLGASVDISSPSEYRGHKQYLTGDGKAGFSISPDGEITSVFSHADGGPKNWSVAAIQQAVHEGGRWLYGFDTVLPHLYSRAGFKPVARLPFDEALLRADKGDAVAEALMQQFSKFNSGRPDVVFMVYDPASKGGYFSRVGGKVAKSFDDAMRVVEREKAKVSKKRLAGYSWAGATPVAGAGLWGALEQVQQENTAPQAVEQ